MVVDFSRHLSIVDRTDRPKNKFVNNIISVLDLVDFSSQVYIYFSNYIGKS